MAKARRNKLLHGEGIEHLTVHHYTEGWKLYAAGAMAGQICRAININNRQLTHLVKEGLPARGRRAAQPSYEQLALEAMAAGRVAATQAGAVISVRGVAVLGVQVENAQAAGDIASMVLQHQRERMALEMAKPAAERDFDKIVIPDSLQDLLRTIRPYTDLRPATQAFRAMYDAHPIDQMHNRHAVPTEPIDVEARPKLPAALAFMDEVVGDGTAAVFVGELTKLMENWTDEEMVHYAQTGEEPQRKE